MNKEYQSLIQLEFAVQYLPSVIPFSFKKVCIFAHRGVMELPRLSEPRGGASRVSPEVNTSAYTRKILVFEAVFYYNTK